MKDRIFSSNHSADRRADQRADDRAHQRDGSGHASFALHLDEISAVICPECETITWCRDGMLIDAEQGVEVVCGDFDVVATLPTVGAPAQRVMVTRPTTKTGQEFVDALPVGAWLRAMPSVWFSPSNGVLLLATSERLSVAG